VKKLINSILFIVFIIILFSGCISFGSQIEPKIYNEPILNSENVYLSTQDDLLKIVSIDNHIIQPTGGLTSLPGSHRIGLQYINGNDKSSAKILEKIFNPGRDYLIIYTLVNNDIQVEIVAAGYTNEYWESQINLPSNNDKVVVTIKLTMPPSNEEYTFYHPVVSVGGFTSLYLKKDGEIRKIIVSKGNKRTTVARPFDPRLAVSSYVSTSSLVGMVQTDEAVLEINSEVLIEIIGEENLMDYKIQCYPVSE
jgi:hypothetical protein